MWKGISSSYFNDLSPEEMVKTFDSKFWSHLELAQEHGFQLLDRGKPAEVGRQFKNFAHEYGVSFPQGHLWLHCDIIGEDAVNTVDQLRHWLDLFEAVGVKSAVLHPGGIYMQENNESKEFISQARVAALTKLCEHIKGSDLVICLENIVKTTPEIEDLLEIMQAVNHENLGICLDTGHLNMTSGRQREFVEKAGSYLKALHIADNEGERDQHIVPYSRGTIDWAEVVSAIKSANYRGLYNLEIGGEKNCPMPIRLAKLDYMQQMLAIMLGER